MTSFAVTAFLWMLASVPLVEKVEVTATTPIIDDPTATVSVLEGEELQQRAFDLGDLLRRVPGARIRDYGGLGRYATISLRASTSEQVAVFVDGVPQNRALGGPVDLSSIAPGSVERIAVYRGGGPASLGLGAIGGVVDIRTRAVGGEPEYGVTGVVGELDTSRVTAFVATPLGTGGRAGALRVDLERTRSTGDYEYLDPGVISDPDDDLVVRRDNNALSGLRGSLLWTKSWAGRGSIWTRLRFRDVTQGLPGSDVAGSAIADWTDRSIDTSIGWTSTSAVDGVPRFDSRLELFGEDLLVSDPQADLLGGAKDLTTSLSGQAWQGRWRTRTKSGNWTVRVRAAREKAQQRNEALAVVDRGGARRTLLELTVEDAMIRGAWTIAPALTLTHADDRFLSGGSGTLPPPAEDSVDTFAAAKIGASRTLGAHSQLRFSFGRFYRQPSMLERFGDRGIVVGNPGLQPEHGLSAEIGLHRSGRRRWSWDVVGFARRVDDQILLLPRPGGVSVPQNLLAAEAIGIELEGSWNLTRSFRLHGAMTQRRTRDRSGGPGDGNRIVFQPDTIASLSADLTRKSWRLFWDLTYTGDNSADSLDDPRTRIPERWMHDLSLSRSFPGGWSLGVDVRNLFDRKYRDVAGFPLPDRVMLLRVGWNGGGRDAS